MPELDPREEVYDRLIRRARLLESPKHQTCTEPVSLRITKLHLEVIKDLCEITGLTKGGVIKAGLEGLARTLADIEQNRRIECLLNKN